jgi:hypothetical protein
VTLAIGLLDAILVAEGWRLRDAEIAGLRSVDVKGIKSCEEEAVVHKPPRKELYCPLISHFQQRFCEPDHEIVSVEQALPFSATVPKGS